jgi:glycosyltransferase involved in cell wall biosynthesis
MNLFFSIIIPTYNRAHRIEKAIDSVINQSFKNWELIIIDDCSTDSTSDIVSGYTDDRLRYYKNNENLERCNSRNRGIDLANGEYICFLDSDDYHLPQHLELLYNEIISRNKPKAFFFVNAWNESDLGERSERSCPRFMDYDPYFYFLRFTVNPQRWAVHKTIFEVVKFDPNVIIAEDMDTSLRILEKGFPIFQIEERTTVYVAASDSFTHGDSQKWEKELFYFNLIFTKKELKKHLPKREVRRLKSMCYFHLAQKNFDKMNRIKCILYVIQSFLFCPSGYNGRTNKILVYNFYKSLVSLFIKSKTV